MRSFSSDLLLCVHSTLSFPMQQTHKTSFSRIAFSVGKEWSLFYSKFTFISYTNAVVCATSFLLTVAFVQQDIKTSFHFNTDPKKKGGLWLLLGKADGFTGVWDWQINTFALKLRMFCLSSGILKNRLMKIFKLSKLSRNIFKIFGYLNDIKSKINLNNPNNKWSTLMYIYIYLVCSTW